MNLWQEYKRPATVEEAIHDLTNAEGPAMPLAGGTDLLLDLKQGRHAPVHTLIDVTFIAEMSSLEMRGETLYIGAAVPVNHIAMDPLVMRHAQALVEACNLIGGPQVRNTATLGGNVAHALPAAEGTIALAALDTQVEVAGPSGRRKEALSSLFLGAGKTALDKSSELITGFFIPIHQVLESEKAYRTASCFKRIMRPQGVALPILNCAIWLVREGEIIKEIHIASGPGGATPFRATEAEKRLRLKPFNEGSITDALESLLTEVKFRSSPRRASADYRRHLVCGLFRDVLETAWQRAEDRGITA